jgi:branched-chain amino acid transport system permease protein
VNGRQILARAWTPLVLGVAVVVVAVVAASGSDELRQVVVTGVVNLVLVIGLYVFVGNSGVFSFGQMGFAAIGAYVAALLTIPVAQKPYIISMLYPSLADMHASAAVATLAGGALAGIVAAVTAVPLMRLGGMAAGLATFALLIIVHVVAANWQQVTNGTTGLTAIPVSTDLRTALAWAVCMLVVAYVFQRSRWGRRLRASREDEPAARAIGIGVAGERRAAFALSGVMSGIGGALLAQQLGTFTPDTFYISASFPIVAMLVVGGINSLTGAVAGTMFITAVSELLSRVEEGTSIGPLHVTGRPGLRDVGLALIMLIALARFPSGLTRGREWVAPRVLRAAARARGDGAVPAAATEKAPA